MHTKLLTAATLAALTTAGTASAATIAEEDFDGNSTLGFTYSPALGSFSSSTDIWDSVSSLATISVGSGNFLGARDIENGDNPNVDFATATTASFDLSLFEATSFSFDYDIDGFDAGDSVSYTVTIDGVESAPVFLVTGLNGVGGVFGDGNEAVAIPDAASSFSFELNVTQNGGSDYAGFDNFVLAGTVIPEPMAAGAAGLLGLVGLRRRRA
ncbi:MAG: hypothetical protein AAGI46_03975 [Planctomycetota bacterium]